MVLLLFCSSKYWFRIKYLAQGANVELKVLKYFMAEVLCTTSASSAFEEISQFPSYENQMVFDPVAHCKIKYISTFF